MRGKEVIIEQIKAREIERLKNREEQEREGQIMVQKMKELQKEEERQNEVSIDLFSANERNNRRSMKRSAKPTGMLS